MSNARNKREVIGIDLGTTCSCVGAWKDNRIKIIPNTKGNPITPSYVAYTDSETLVGDEAKKRAIWNYKNTIFDSKRLIGRSISDMEVKKDIKHWPFEVMEKDGKLVYSVNLKQKTIYPTPKDIASEILKSLKSGAEQHLGNTVKNAVITVPAYFYNAQRQDTIEAGSIVGLNVLSILNEPTAAAIAYGFDNQKNHKRTVLVFDLGGGTFDVSLLNIVGGNFKVLATSGNTHLGGNDFDVRLVEYLLKEVKYKTGYVVSSNRSVVARLRAQSERVKCALSSREIAYIDIDSLFNEIDFQSTISRTNFNEICNDLFKSTLVYLDQVLNDTKLRKTDVDEIVMIGGSTRIPEIQRLVSHYFDDKELNKSINPEEAVARGAILNALKLTDNIENVFKGLSLVDITPISLGIEIVGEVMFKVVSRNTELPFIKTKPFTTSLDYQTSVGILVYEGEKKHSKSNHLLGEFVLTGIPPALKHIPKIDVTFTIDSNGILKVRAYSCESHQSEEIKIIYSINCRDKSKIVKPLSKKTGDIVLAED